MTEEAPATPAPLRVIRRIGRHRIKRGGRAADIEAKGIADWERGFSVGFWRRRQQRAGLGDESGFTMIEMLAALSIMSVAFFALAMGASTGLRLVSQGRQRQAAAEVANARMEHLRNIPYEMVALSENLTQGTEISDPDYYVSSDGAQYDHTGSGDFETLLVDTTNGQVLHIETPVEIGETTLSVHQYVTWVDDPGIVGTEDYKRLTVVVSYIAAIPVGRPRTVRASALFTSGGVTLDGTAQGATEGTASTPTPSPSATPTGSCAGDTSGPTGDFSILSGTGALSEFTASTNVSISLTPSDACLPITYAFSNDGSTFGATGTYDAGNPSATWTLPSGDGSKHVWTRYIDGVGNATTIGFHSVRLDQTLPTTPSGVTRTVSCSGLNRTVNLSWGASVDAHLLGHRIYKSVNDGAYTVIGTTASGTLSDTDSKNLDSLHFYIVGYDKAGNESVASSEITLAKHQCT